MTTAVSDNAPPANQHEDPESAACRALDRAWHEYTNTQPYTPLAVARAQEVARLAAALVQANSKA